MRNLDLLMPADQARDTVGWATVTDIGPLRIRRDGEDDPLPVTPDTLIGPLSVSDRVWVGLATNDDSAFRARRVIVIGRAGGVEAELDDHEDRIIDLESAVCVEDVENASGTTTSTSYTATLSGGGAAACGIAFVAPASGTVLIHNNCTISNNTAAVATHCTVRVRTGNSIGSGSDVLAASDTNAVQHPGTSPFRAGATKLLTGLTPGADYNVQQVFRVASASTGTFADKNLIVEGK